MRHESLPVVIIGAGPVGLAAAAHALSRHLTPLVLEAGGSVGAGIRRWGHVRMFSPWKFNLDAAAATILGRHGWSRPAGDEYPTGHDLVERYLEPLARTGTLGPYIRTNARVAGVTRQGHDRMKEAARSAAPFVVRVVGPAGEEDVLARAVVDASGTIETPGTLGAAGVPALGERALAERIFYGMPDVLGAARARYANRRVLVVGSGHSALNVLLDLSTLAEQEPGTHIRWAIRRQELGPLLGGARPDQLEERGRLGSRVRSLLDRGRVELITGFRIDRVAVASAGAVVSAADVSLAPADEIIAATGFRPDWTILSEVRLDLDPAVDSPRALAPLIDPNVHSCGTVPPHGAEDLKQPEVNLFVIGMKSYGRAPTFLMLTGYEQARSVMSAIAGDWDAARRVELVLPDTGVCSIDQSGDAASSCCGTASPEPEAVTLGGLSATRPWERSADSATPPNGRQAGSARSSHPSTRRSGDSPGGRRQ
jgi:thioredoxin reductase